MWAISILHNSGLKIWQIVKKNAGYKLHKILKQVSKKSERA